jgi:hypothetical protein
MDSPEQTKARMTETRPLQWLAVLFAENDERIKTLPAVFLTTALLDKQP